MKHTHNHQIVICFLMLFMFFSITVINAQNSDNQKDSDYSDVRLSKNVEPINGALKKLVTAKGVYYNYRTDEFKNLKLDTLRHLGVMAQELEKAIPELVNTNANGYKSVDYEQMVPLLLEAIKELTLQNKGLTAQYIHLLNLLMEKGVVDKDFNKKPAEKK